VKHQLEAVRMSISAALDAAAAARKVLGVVLPLVWQARRARMIQAFKNKVGDFLGGQTLVGQGLGLGLSLGQGTGMGNCIPTALAVGASAAAVSKAGKKFSSMMHHHESLSLDAVDKSQNHYRELALISVPGSGHRWHSRSKWVKLNSLRRNKQGKLLNIEENEQGVEQLPALIEPGE
jgi:hypothetical protein